MKHQNLITAAVLGMMTAAVVASPVPQGGSALPAEEKEGCKGKDGCNGKKKEEEKKEGTVLFNASVTPEEKDSCKGKDGCNGKKKEEEKKDGSIL